MSGITASHTPRRLWAILAACGLVAGLTTLATPAAAAPKNAFTWTVTCGSDAPFAVVADSGLPGWPNDSSAPVLLVGGTFTSTVDGVTGTFSKAVPSGLVGLVRRCTIDGPVGIDPNVFHVHSDPAFMFFVG